MSLTFKNKKDWIDTIEKYFNSIWITDDKNIEENIKKMYKEFWLTDLWYQIFNIKKVLAYRINWLFIWKILSKKLKEI